VFYNVVRLSEEVASEDAREMVLADVYSDIFPLVREDKDFLALIDAEGTTLQIMYDEDADHYCIEVPRPDLQGSFGTNISFDEAIDLIKSLKGLFPREGFEGFEFQAW
jgi:hypothetical protein